MKISAGDTTFNFNTILVKVMGLLICLAVIPNHLGLISAAKESESAEEYLMKTGMSLWEIEALDSDARQFIADDLRNSDGRNWRVNTNILTLTKTSSEQYTVAFYINVFAFQAGLNHRIYAVYESSTGIMPAENDRLFLGVGDGFMPREYGGRIWYKKAGDENWVQGGELAADCKTAEGGTFTGRQLGDFQGKMLVKGCVYCYAGEGTGDDNRVTVEYTYEPAKESNEVRLYVMIIAITIIVVLILRKSE